MVYDDAVTADKVWAAASKPGSIVRDEVSNYVRTFWGGKWFVGNCWCYVGSYHSRYI